MDIIDKILEKHTQKYIGIETYKISEDIEIGVHQDHNSIYIYAYSQSRDRNLSIKTNFPKLWRGLGDVATDGYIRQEKGFTYKLTLRAEEEPQQVISANSISAITEEITELEELRVKVKELARENEQLKEELERIKLSSVQDLNSGRKHNERGAGRKSRFTDEDIEVMKHLRQEGKSIRSIAKEYGCSVGLVHKLISEQKRN